MDRPPIEVRIAVWGATVAWVLPFAAPVSYGAPRTTGSSPPSGEVVFARKLDERHTRILATSITTRRTRQLSGDNVADDSPSVSPNGNAIAFVRRSRANTRFPRSEIWIMNRNGRSLHRVTRGHADSDPAWRLDGHRLLLSRITTNARGEWASGVASVRIDGSGLEILTRPPLDDDGVCDFGPTPWPGHGAMAFASSSDCTHAYSASIEAVGESGQPIPILGRLNRGSTVFAFSFVAWPDFSPDGSRIAFEVFDGEGLGTGPAGIYLAAPDGSKPTLLAKDGHSPAWSPDGRWVAFARAGDVWIIRADGTSERRLTRTSREESSPDWLP